MNQSLKNTLKSIVSNGLFYTGVCAAARRNLKNRLIILTYHSFTDGSPVPLLNRMPVLEFERQIIYLKKYYHIVSLSKGLELIQGDNDNARNARPFVSITIDDGFSDNYYGAFPILRKHGIPATIFLSTDFIDNGRPPWPTQIVKTLRRTLKTQTSFPFSMPISTEHEKSMAIKIIKGSWRSITPEERFELLEGLGKHLNVSPESEILPLNWDQIREMKEFGIEIGSHTVYHSMLPAIDRDPVLTELVISKRRIEEETDMECSFFSYPDGSWNDDSRFSVIKTGYKGAVTQDWGSNSRHQDKYSLKRIEIPYNEKLEVFACRVTLLFNPNRHMFVSKAKQENDYI